MAGEPREMSLRRAFAAAFLSNVSFFKHADEEGSYMLLNVAAVAAIEKALAGAGYVLVSRATLAWAKAHLVEPPTFYGPDVAALAELDRVLGETP